jgi:hypothetical protein
MFLVSKDTGMHSARAGVKSLINSAGLFAAALLATSAVCLLALPLLGSVISTPSVSETVDAFGILSQQAFLVKPEPVESAVFLVTMLTGVLFISIAAWASIKVDFGRGMRWVFVATTAGAATSIAVWVKHIFGTAPTFPLGGLLAPSIFMERQLFFTLCGLFAALIAALAVLPDQGRWKLVPWIFAAVPLSVLARFTILGNYDAYPGNGHYEVFVYPLIQDWLGDGIYLGAEGQKSQYGLYPLFLRPIWYLSSEPSTVAVTATMAVFLLLSFLCTLSFVVRFSRQPVLAAVLTLAAVMGTLLIYPVWPADPYFQFFPLRLIFPSIALGLLCWRRTRETHHFLSYVLLALGLVWNFESGLVGLATYWVFIVAAQFKPRVSYALKVAAVQAALVAAAVLIAVGCVLVYYLARFGMTPDFSGILGSVRLFSGGIGNEPMPWLGTWGLHCLVYCTAGFVGLRSLWTSETSEDRYRGAALLCMVVAGIIWFRYYQGRSLPAQLQFVSLPALCCFALLLDHLVGAFGRLKRWTALVASVAIGAPLMAALSVWVLSEYTLMRPLDVTALSSHPDATWNRASDQVVATFESVKQKETDELLVLAPYAHLINLKRGKSSPIHSAGVCQIWFEEEFDAVIRLILAPDTRMVVVDSTPSCNQFERFMRAPVQAPEARLSALLQREFDEAPAPADCGEQAPRIFIRKGTPLKSAPSRGNLVNVATGRSAAESTSFATSNPAAAVDGNVDGVYASGSTTHTEVQVGPWWEVDLGEVKDIDSIELWNRTDCCGDRLYNFWILASEQRLPTDEAAAAASRRSNVHSSFRPSASACRTTKIKAGFRARFVRVQLDGKGVLSLAEVRVLSPKSF